MQSKTLGFGMNQLNSNSLNLLFEPRSHIKVNTEWSLWLSIVSIQWHLILSNEVWSAKQSVFVIIIQTHSFLGISKFVGQNFGKCNTCMEFKINEEYTKIRRTSYTLQTISWPTRVKRKIDILFCTTYIEHFYPKMEKSRNEWLFAWLFASQNSLCGSKIFNVHAHHIDRWTIFTRITVLCRHIQTHCIILPKVENQEPSDKLTQQKKKKNWWVTIVIFGLLFSRFWKQMYEDICV